jgi:hypothetical protein
VVRVWFLEGTRDFSLLQSIQTSSGIQSVSYEVGTRDCFLEGKVVWGVKLTILLHLMPYIFMALCFKNKENFTCTVT